MSVTEGRRRRRVGIRRVVHHSGDFIWRMRRQAQRIAERNGNVNSDDLRDYANSHGIRPHHPNAWGAIFRASEWEMVGWKVSRLSSNHSRYIRVWRWRGR